MTDSRADPDDEIIVTCVTCHERMSERPGKKPRQVACTFCGAKVRVPARDEMAARKVRTVAENVKDVGEYAVGAVHEPPPVSTHFFEVRAEVKSVRIDPPPQWAFFSSVYLFPWRSDVLLRWAFMTGGCFIVFLVAAVAITLAGNIGGPQGVVLAFFVLPEIWLGTWTFSYVASCCLRVLTDTSAGVDRIENWPEPNWREWAGDLMYVVYILGLTAGIGFGMVQLALLAGLLEWVWPVMLGTVFVLFPILLLSAMESGSLLMPFSPPILRSLVALWWGWLLCYALWGVLAAAWIALAVFGVQWQPFLAILFAAPLLPAVLLISARLLGRLAWRASH